MRILFWPVERIAAAFGGTWAEPWSERLGAWFRLALKPWKYFDPPAARERKRGGEG